MTWLRKWEDLQEQGVELKAQSLRRFVAEPETGREGPVRWHQSLGSMNLTIPLVQGNLKEEDLLVQASTCQLQVQVQSKPVAGLNGMLCGTLLPSLCYWRLEQSASSRMTRGVDEAFVRSTLHIHLTKATQASWPQLWYNKDMKHPAARSGYAWTSEMEAAQTTSERTALRDLPAHHARQPGLAFAPDDLCVAVDAQQDPKTLTVRVHFDAEALEVARRMIPLEDLLAVDVHQDRVNVHLQSDPQNPILFAQLAGRCRPKESSWSMTTCDAFRDRQQNPGAPGHTLVVVLVKHQEEQGQWPQLFRLCLQHALMLKNYDELHSISEALREDDGVRKLSPEEKRELQLRMAEWQEERFALMPGAQLLPRAPELSWALRSEETED